VSKRRGLPWFTQLNQIIRCAKHRPERSSFCHDFSRNAGAASEYQTVAIQVVVQRPVTLHAFLLLTRLRNEVYDPNVAFGESLRRRGA
jgi:hypothetical protein